MKSIENFNKVHFGFLILSMIFFGSRCSDLNNKTEQSNIEKSLAYVTTGMADELYFGIENEIKLIAPGIGSPYIFLSVSGGNSTIRREGSSCYVKPTLLEDVIITLKNMENYESKEFKFKVIK